MDRRAQLQFKLLTAEAQRSAIRRLALSGMSDGVIAQTTGWTTADVRRVLDSPTISDLRTRAPRSPMRFKSSVNRLPEMLAQ